MRKVKPIAGNMSNVHIKFLSLTAPPEYSPTVSVLSALLGRTEILAREQFVFLEYNSTTTK